MGDCSAPRDPCDPLGAAVDGEIGNNWEQPFIGIRRQLSGPRSAGAA